MSLINANSKMCFQNTPSTPTPTLAQNSKINIFYEMQFQEDSMKSNLSNKRVL